MNFFFTNSTYLQEAAYQKSERLHIVKKIVKVENFPIEMYCEGSTYSVDPSQYISMGKSSTLTIFLKIYTTCNLAGFRSMASWGYEEFMIFLII